MRSLISCVAALAGILATASAPAATYNYRGSPFTEAMAPYQIGQRVTGTLELVEALPANMAATDIPIANFVDMMFVDGQQVRTRANSVICRLVLGTDADANINSWIIWTRASTVGANNARYSLETFNVPGFAADLAGIGTFPGACDTGSLEPRASTNVAGSWIDDNLYANGFED